MEKYYKPVKAHLFWAILGLVVAVAGIVVTLIVFPNWDSHAEIEVTFPINEGEKITSYYSINTESLRICQGEGNSDCSYTIYLQSRNQSSYDEVVRDLSFSDNDEWNGETYSLDSHWWNDIRFKIIKSSEVSVKSVITLNLGEEE